jgi:hypothetical protein
MFPTSAQPLSLVVDLVDMDIPLLIGKSTLADYDLCIDAKRRKVISPLGTIDLVDDGHLTIPLCHNPAYESFYTRSQIRSMHRHYLHPSTTKLYEILKRANPNISSDTRDLIEEITKACSSCSEYSSRPLHFSVRSPDDVVFNQELLIDVMYIENRPVLHIVDRGTRFSAARFLAKVDTETVWTTFVRAWSSLYIGFPHSMLTDQGSVFMSRTWRGMCAVADISLRHTGVESHNSLNVGESLHGPLRRIYLRVHDSHPGLTTELCLAISVKAMNDTFNADGLCPTLLVFGVAPRVPNAEFVLPNNVERFRAMQLARAEYAKIVAQQRTRKAANAKPPSNEHIGGGDMVYVYREKPQKWVGPVKCLYRDEKLVLVAMGTGAPVAFNVSQVKRAPIDDPIPTMYTGRTLPDFVLITEVLQPGDPRESLFGPAIHKEITGLIDRGTFKIELRPEGVDTLNILPSRFVLAIKRGENGNEILKARFVVGGHRDRLKDDLVHIASTVRHSHVRMIFALAAILGFDVWTSDVRQAYLQAATPLLRDGYIKTDVISLAQDEVLRLLKPLYGLSDSGDYWSKTLSDFHAQQLRLEQATGDFALYFRRLANKLVGISSTYVDDLLQAGTPEFRQDMERQFKSSFDMADTKCGAFTFAGIQAENGKRFSLHQNGYIDRLDILPSSASFSDYRAQRAKVAWITNTRPDICCAVSMSAQVTQSQYQISHLRMLNGIVRYLQSTMHVKLRYPKLDIGSLQVVTYADASFANREDKSSQIGYAIFMADMNRDCCLLQYRSQKSRRVVRSSTAAETLAFAAAFDGSFIFRHDLARMLGRHIPLLMLTDSEALFKTLTKTRYTSERRLLVDIAAARQAYQMKEISNIGLIASSDNVADGLTKLSSNPALYRALTTEKLDHPVLQWVMEGDMRHGALRR